MNPGKAIRIAHAIQEALVRRQEKARLFVACWDEAIDRYDLVQCLTLRFVGNSKTYPIESSPEVIAALLEGIDVEVLTVSVPLTFFKDLDEGSVHAAILDQLNEHLQNVPMKFIICVDDEAQDLVSYADTSFELSECTIRISIQCGNITLPLADCPTLREFFSDDEFAKIVATE